jgi:small-conductance mechanosensitive channel
VRWATSIPSSSASPARELDGPIRASSASGKEGTMDLIWIIVIVLVVLALLGYFGFGRRRGL